MLFRSYFRVFGCKCFILNKKVKSSKFAPRVDEGFLLGYASNAHGYRVFNNTTGLVEIVIDMTFDETNGSQGHVSSGTAGNEELPCEAIKKLAIGEVRPQEKDDEMSILSRSALSAAAFCSASAFMRLISSSLKPDEASMRILCSLPVALSLAGIFPWRDGQG